MDAGGGRAGIGKVWEFVGNFGITGEGDRRVWLVEKNTFVDGMGHTEGDPTEYDLKRCADPYWRELDLDHGIFDHF